MYKKIMNKEYLSFSGLKNCLSLKGYAEKLLSILQEKISKNLI